MGKAPVDAAPAQYTAPGAYDAAIRDDAAVDANADEFDAVILAITNQLGNVGLGQWRLTAKREDKAAQLDWLSKDFGTASFSKASDLDEAVLLTKTKDGPLHVGLLRLHFHSCKLLRTALAGVENAKRLNFLLPVLTIFRTRERDHTLLFVLSETPLHKGVEDIFSDIGAVAGVPTACVDVPKSVKPNNKTIEGVF